MLCLFLWCFVGIRVELVELHPLEFQGNPAVILSTALGDGSVFLAHPTQGTVLRYDDHGKALPPIGKKGQGPGEFNWPCLLFYQTPYLYVCDTNQQKLYRIDPSTGKFLKHWSLAGANALSIKGDELFTCFVDPLKEQVLGIADLTGELRFRRLLGDSPCCLDVSGSHKGAVMHASDGTLWGAFTGEYNIQHFSSDGKLLNKITRAPLGYVKPSQKKGISRYDTSALSENVRSFDKFDGIYELSEHILIYRFKTSSSSSLDIYTKHGVYVGTAKSDGLQPVAAVTGGLLVIKDTPVNSKWDIVLCRFTVKI